MNPWEDPKIKQAALKVCSEHGINDITLDNAEYDNELHSWRCAHPDRYPDYCHCVTDLVTEILAAVGPMLADRVEADHE